MKNAFALFPDETSANEAVKKLKAADEVDDFKIKIHSQSTIKDNLSLNAIPGGTGTASGTGSTAAPGAATAGAGGVGAFMTDDNVRSYLDRIGVPGDQQAYFAHGIKNGGFLVHVPESGDDVDTAERIMEEAGGKASQAK
ncbi:MAG: hypothetical protein ACLFP4_09570 [Spirochaetales bacterium]